MTELENKNINQLRKKITEMKTEQSKLEDQLIRHKESVIMEEGRLRQTKSLATEQLRVLQSDLNKINNDFKMKQRSLSEMEKNIMVTIIKLKLFN